MKYLKVLIDYDDVLFPLVPHWVEAINNTYGTNVLPEQITEWNITKFFPALSKEEVFEPLYRDTFWKELAPEKDAVSILAKILKNGHDIKIVTATFYQNVKPKMERLFECFPFISWDDVIITSRKQMINGDVLIDDKPENLLNGAYHKILFERPHNRYYNDKVNGMFRAHGLHEAYMEICRLSREKCLYYDKYDGWKQCLNCKNGFDDDGALYCKVDGYGEFETDD